MSLQHSTLKAAIGTAAADVDESADIRVIGVLQQRLADSQKRKDARLETEESQRKAASGRTGQAVLDMMDKHRKEI